MSKYQSRFSDMTYADGVTIQLGDVISVPIPTGEAKARVVMLGDTYAHLDLDASVLRWVTSDKVLESGSVVVEWIGQNPLAHDDPRYAPVGKYLFSPVDQYLRRVVG
jgi:hypothetical protein